MAGRWIMFEHFGNLTRYRRVGLPHITVRVYRYPATEFDPEEYSIRVSSRGKELGHHLYTPRWFHGYPLPTRIVGAHARRIINHYRELNS